MFVYPQNQGSEKTLLEIETFLTLIRAYSFENYDLKNCTKKSPKNSNRCPKRAFLSEKELDLYSNMPPRNEWLKKRSCAETKTAVDALHTLIIFSLVCCQFYDT